MPHKFPALVARIVNDIDEVTTSEDISEYHAWSRVAADLLGYDREAVEFFDNNDSGIDFYYANSPTYEIYQAKMHEWDQTGVVHEDEAFDQRGIQDLDRACSFLLNIGTPRNVDQRLMGLRARIQEDLKIFSTSDQDSDKGISVTFNLVVLGTRRTPGFEAELNNFKTRLRELSRTNPGLDASFEFHGLEELEAIYPRNVNRTVEPISLRIGSDHLKFSGANKGEIRSDNMLTFYTHADDLVLAAQKAGPSLFDANVRYELKKSNVNETIKRSATHAKTMRLFHIYNNGVTITAEGWSFKGDRLEARKPSIINGCQTVRSLQAAKKQLTDNYHDSAHLLETFEKNCAVMVRVIRRNAVDVEEIVQAANTQNVMEPRNLLSNRTEQLQLERDLQELGWFYERKDGAKDALQEAKRTSLNTPIAKFQFREKGKRTALRSVDNRAVAQAWLSFIGYSDEGQNKRKAHFNDTPSGLYRKVFRQCPSGHREVEILAASHPTMKEGRPPSAWILFSHHLYRIVKHLLPTASALRSNIRNQIKASGEQPTTASVNTTLMDDAGLRLRFALSMLDHVIVELVGFIFARSLGEQWLDGLPAQRALTSGVIGLYNKTGQMNEEIGQRTVLELDEQRMKDDSTLLAIRLAAKGVESTLAKPEFMDGFRSAERKSRYLQGEQLILEFARMIDLYDRYFSEGNFETWWRGRSPYAVIRKAMLESPAS